MNDKGHLSAGANLSGKSARRNVNAPGNKGEKHYQRFGMVTDGRPIRRLKFYPGGGVIVSVPYGYQPLLIYEPDGYLWLRMSNLTIRITGRGLDILERYVADEAVLWIRADSEITDDPDDPMYVTEILLEGELID